MSKKWEGPQVEGKGAEALFLHWKEIVDRLDPLLAACREGKATAAQLGELEDLREQILALHAALSGRQAR